MSGAAEASVAQGPWGQWKEMKSEQPQKPYHVGPFLEFGEEAVEKWELLPSSLSSTLWVNLHFGER